MKIIAFSGHRGSKLPGGWDELSDGNKAIFSYICSCLNEETKKQPIKVITGGAKGIDIMAALAVQEVNGWSRIVDINLRPDFEYINQIIYEPFEGYNSKWPKESIVAYERMKSYSQIPVKIICEPNYSAYKLQLRNEAMVNDCDELWAFWNGTQGGTKNCIEYAKSKNKKIRNLYEEYNAK